MIQPYDVVHFEHWTDGLQLRRKHQKGYGNWTHICWLGCGSYCGTTLVFKEPEIARELILEVELFLDEQSPTYELAFKMLSKFNHLCIPHSLLILNSGMLRIDDCSSFCANYVVQI